MTLLRARRDLQHASSCSNTTLVGTANVDTGHRNAIGEAFYQYIQECFSCGASLTFLQTIRTERNAA